MASLIIPGADSVTSVGACKSPTPPRTVCNCFTVTQAMYIVVLSIGRLYEHHMVPENVCDA